MKVSQLAVFVQMLAATAQTCAQTPGCIGSTLGLLPSSAKMPATQITTPLSGSTIPVSALKVTLKVTNFNAVAGNKAYLSMPQQLGRNGFINGKIQLSIQKLDANVADAADTLFFRVGGGVSDSVSNAVFNVPQSIIKLAQGGRLRICSILGGDSLQPVVMPVAQRGAQDDCVRVFVALANNGGRKASSKVQNGSQVGANGVSFNANASVSNDSSSAIAVSTDSSAIAVSTDTSAIAVSTDSVAIAFSTESSAIAVSTGSVTDSSSTTGAKSTIANTINTQATSTMTNTITTTISTSTVTVD